MNLNQKGINAVQECSVENQKGTIAIDFVQDTGYSTLQVLKGTSLNSDILPFSASGSQMMYCIHTGHNDEFIIDNLNYGLKKNHVNVTNSNTSHYIALGQSHSLSNHPNTSHLRFIEWDDTIYTSCVPLC